MATKNASNHQGQVKDPEHDGRLKGHHGGEAAKAHSDGRHPDEKHAEPKKTAATKHDDEATHEESRKAGAAKAQTGSGEGADLKSREYTDAQGNIHHHTKASMEGHKGE